MNSTSRSATRRPRAVVRPRGRHVAVTPRRRLRRPTPLVRGTLLTASAIGAAAVLAAAAAMGSYALLSSQATLSSGSTTLTAGALSTTINNSSSTSVAITAPGKLLPGDYYSQAVSVGIAGDVSATLSVALAAASTSYEVRIYSSACPSTGYSTTALGTSLTTSTLALGTVPPGATYTGCIQIGMLAGAPTTTNTTASVTPTSASASFTLTLTALQASG